MKKRILIVTDFTVRSLNLLKEALTTSHTKGETVDVVLVHGIFLPDSSIDLLFYSKRTLIKELTGSEFTSACHLIKNKYQSTLNIMTTDLFSGLSQRSFDEYLVKEQIDEIYMGSWKSKSCHSRSFDLNTFVRNTNKVNKIIVKLDSEPSTTVDAYQDMVELFFSRGHVVPSTDN
ncbi:MULTISPECIES: hypothetical protein [Reichenbachiella]|uniref:Universal stress protein family protein n=1 Tax=Reichenbachiella agariperforans TaxID=156994 RepID=A0A1M6T3S7_REIAG|nr:MULTISPECIES: hypothetical protein [Reichenbachiella]MBU2914826.1 hypothetical protein [Reichenbachiella agariperforans]RJE75204.1 hypothetical protein BGP76_19065 [Reichenbachiella sp. MSK19-1]SHK51458.1 hypothetical protein SAMN04488028_105269 [Reichenbachiella agariperforans]